MAIAMATCGILSTEMEEFLGRAYQEMRCLRTSTGVEETDVAWNEGYFRGVIEAAAMLTAMSPDDLTSRASLLHLT